MINFTDTQLEAVTKYVIELSPKEEIGFRRTLEEMKMLYNPEMENCIIVKSRVFEIDNGEQYDKLRYMCFNPDEQWKMLENYSLTTMRGIHFIMTAEKYLLVGAK